MTMIRIATVKATGLRYVVRGLTQDLERAILWGHITSYHGVRSTGAVTGWKFLEGETVLRSTIDVVEVPATRQLAESLLQQSKNAGLRRPVPPRLLVNIADPLQAQLIGLVAKACDMSVDQLLRKARR
jgi:hypothetical protein